jgi:hypothetical protein
MTRVLVWKELREQWVVWLVLAAVTVGGVATLHALLSPNHYRDDMLVGVLWLSAWGYGLVCGSLLFAGETEEGTQAFLDLLPGTRRRMWRTKAGVGLGLLAAQAALLALAEALLLPHVRSDRLAGVEQVGIFLYGVMGYAWGLYSGSRSATVLGAIARGVLAQVVVAAVPFPFLVLALQVFVGYHTVDTQLMTMTAVLALATTWPVVRSRFNYCQTDWQRVRALRPAGGPVRQSWGEAFRLAARESRWFALGMAAFGLVGAVALAALGTLAWPVATVLIGVLCGVTVLGHGSREDDAETGRASAGRLAVARIGVRLAIAVGAAVLTASVPLALFVAAVEVNARGDLSSVEVQLVNGTLAELFQQPFLFLFLWLVDGFAVGLLCGACVRWTLAASLIAVPWACLLGALWLPEVLLAERLHAWQVWGAPAVLFAAAFYLTRARDRLSPLRTAGIAACAGVVAIIGSGAAVWYRAAEFPAAANAFDVDAYRASLPSAEENEAGRLTSAALRRLEAATRGLPNEQLRRLQLRGIRLDFETNLVSLAKKVASAGWNQALPVKREGREWHRDDRDARDLRFFLDGMFNDAWARDLARAAELPTDVVVDPREVLDTSTLLDLAAAQDAAALLVARGLQRQQDRDPAAFVDHLRTGLALARSLRYRTITQSLLASCDVEEQMGRGVELWLKGLEERPELLRQALEVLREHGRAPRADLEDARKADFLVAINRIANPAGRRVVPPNQLVFDQFSAEFMVRHFADILPLAQSVGVDFFRPESDPPLRPGLRLWSGAPGDAELIRVSFRAPWERVRLRRMLEQVADRSSLEEPDAPTVHSLSQLERITDLVAPFFAMNGQIRQSVDLSRNRCDQAEQLVSRRIETYETDHPTEKAGHAEKQSEKK